MEGSPPGRYNARGIRRGIARRRGGCDKMTGTASAVSHFGTVAMRPEIRDLVRQRLVIYDGGMGTMLFAAGLVDGESPEPWNWEKPDVVREVYRSYYQAGSDVVQNNTVGGPPNKPSGPGPEERTFRP